MSMLRWLVVGLIVSVGGSVASADDKVDYAKLIVGKWEASKTDPGTIPSGTIIEFTKDGKMKISAKKDEAEFNIEATYKIEKNTFVMTMKLGEDEKTQTITITKITDSAMSTEDKDGKKVELTRKK